MCGDNGDSGSDGISRSFASFRFIKWIFIKNVRNKHFCLQFNILFALALCGSPLLFLSFARSCNSPRVIQEPKRTVLLTASIALFIPLSLALLFLLSRISQHFYQSVDSFFPLNMNYADSSIHTCVCVFVCLFCILCYDFSVS